MAVGALCKLRALGVPASLQCAGDPPLSTSIHFKIYSRAEIDWI